MKKSIVSFSIVLLTVAASLFPQELSTNSSVSSFSIHTVPGFNIPLSTGAELFYPGASARITGEYSFTKAPLVFFGSAGIDYNFIPDRAQNFISIIAGEGGLGFYYEILPRLSINAKASGGGYYSFIHDTDPVRWGASGSFSGGGGIDFILSPSMSISLGAYYKRYFGLYSGLSIQIGTSFYLSGKEGRKESIERGSESGPKIPGIDEGIKIRNLNFGAAYPVFYKYYDDHPVGTALLENIDSDTVTEISLSLLVEQYMDAPKDCEVPDNLQAGESADVNLFALFKDTVMEITEGTKVPAELVLEYRIGKDLYRETQVHTIWIHHRNALTWDDDRKAAAFVTAKDPVVLQVSKNIAGIARNRGIKAVNKNISIAIGIHEALSLYGINYVIDPSTPYGEFSEDASMVDFLQFPRHTLNYRAGDCDDLSILYCAMLESAGVPTGFITVPGHIFMAFSAGVGINDLRGGLLDFDEVIIHDDNVWIPIEITEREHGFLRAWQIGIEEWQRFAPEGSADLYPVAEAWELYKPAAIREPMEALVFPDNDAVLAAYMKEANKYLDTHIQPLISTVLRNIESDGATPRLLNKLGILYARYGKIADAEKAFLDALQSGDYPPVYMNLGNIYLIQERYEEALEYFDLAARRKPDDARLLLSLARVYYGLADYDAVDRNYARVKEKSPELAARFSYLDLSGSEGARAANLTEMRETALWQE